MIKAVIFDSGGVLHENNTAVSDDLKQELGLTDEQLKEIWQDQIQRMGIGQLDESSFWEEVSNKYGVRKVDSSEKLLSRGIKRELKQNQRVLEVARQLGQAGLKMAVLSDTNAIHAKVLAEAGNYEPFAYRFLSHETGIRKPDPRIFLRVFEVLKIEAGETIFIDDNPDNVRAAERLGTKGIVFRDTDQFIQELSALLPDVDFESR
jgi:epoxide hydrolase-like predicted phosphatase